MHPERPSDPEPRVLSLSCGPVSLTDRGESPEGALPVLALHGLPGTVRDFRWLGAALEPHLRFVRVDLAGFGGTPIASAPLATIEGRAAFLPELLDALEIERACILGHSMGGPVALAAAQRWPERFPALALLASVGLRPHRLFRSLPMPGAFALGLRTPLLGWPLRRFYRRGLGSAGFRGHYTDESLIHLATSVAAVSFESIAGMVRGLTAPTLTAWAGDDPFIEAEIFEELDAALPEGPRLVFGAGGHNLQKSQAVEIAEALRAWLAALQEGSLDPAPSPL
ncbi:MAG: alpha/beta hydrolase [Deltaproteobacteria bacterium]|nr:alpha/beta hydrolase [Deltaproteobacteria bacterium]